ncbi:hypothetical protein ACLKA6_008202 [Drosophila palustris]
MGVIYKILKQQRHQQHQQQCINKDLSSAIKCKVQAAIKQRQLQRLEVQEQELQEQQEQEEQQDSNEDTLAELCRFLAENAARKKRQRFRLQHNQHQHNQHNQHNHNTVDDQVGQQPLCELQSPPAASTHEMDLLMEQLSSTYSSSDVISQATTTTTMTMATLSSGAPRDSILLKIRHQIFERKRQRQRQLAELVKQRLVVWRPW